MAPVVNRTEGVVRRRDLNGEPDLLACPFPALESLKLRNARAHRPGRLLKLPLLHWAHHAPILTLGLVQARATPASSNPTPGSGHPRDVVAGLGGPLTRFACTLARRPS